MKYAHFYKNKIALNVMAKDIENAIEVYETAEKNVYIAVISKQFANNKSCIEYINQLKKHVDAISIGLGAGDPNQWKVVMEIAGEANISHINQVFTSSIYAKGYLNAKGFQNTIVNSLISPTDNPKRVRISTGPTSSLREAAIVDVDTAVSMLKEIGIDSVKFYNMEGRRYLDSLREMAKACVREKIDIIEPTGGITPNNISDIVNVCLDAGCNKIMPHVYTSIIDKSTGKTDISLLTETYERIKELI